MLLIAAHILSRCSSKSIPKTLHERCGGRKPSFKYIRILGCLDYVKKTKVEKLEARFLRRHFIGYTKDLIGYLFYLHVDQKIIVALQAHFLEFEFIREVGAGRMIVLSEFNETPKELTVQGQQTKPTVTQPPLLLSSRVS